MKKQFRIRLFEGANKIAELVALEAARYNGKGNMTIPLLHSFGMTVKIMSREDETQVEQIGENTLHIDTKVNGEWETVCIIEQIEVFEMVVKEEKEEVL